MKTWHSPKQPIEIDMLIDTSTQSPKNYKILWAVRLLLLLNLNAPLIYILRSYMTVWTFKEVFYSFCTGNIISFCDCLKYPLPFLREKFWRKLYRRFNRNTTAISLLTMADILYLMFLTVRMWVNWLKRFKRLEGSDCCISQARCTWFCLLIMIFSFLDFLYHC